MTYTAPTAAQLRADIASTKRRMNDWLCEGRLDSDTERDMLGEIADMEADLAFALDEAEFVAAMRKLCAA